MLTSVSARAVRLLKVLALPSMIAFASCETTSEPPQDTPAVYEFTNVNYTGQSVRILLTDTLMTIIKGLDDNGAQPATKSQLEAIYDNSAGLFTDIATNKKLSDKISGAVTPTLAADIRGWFDTLEVRSARFAGSAEAVTTDQGLYLPEFIEKGIMGSVFYAQAINYLVNEVPIADNATEKPGEGTKMQHNWDEAFGYFGAARKYLSFTSDEISKNPSHKDVNQDGKIDKLTERNWYFARYAGSRDKGFNVFTSAQTKYAETIFKAFIDGRAAINAKDRAKREAATTVILDTWDKIIASSAIKYAVDVQTRLATGYNGPWAELKMFVDMTQYNPTNKLGAAGYAELKSLIGETPAGMTAEKLTQIINKIKTAYGF